MSSGKIGPIASSVMQNIRLNERFLPTNWEVYTGAFMAALDYKKISYRTGEMEFYYTVSEAEQIAEKAQIAENRDKNVKSLRNSYIWSTERYRLHLK